MKELGFLPTLAQQCRLSAIDAARVEAARRAGIKRCGILPGDMTALEWARQRIHHSIMMGGAPYGFHTLKGNGARLADYCSTPEPCRAYNSRPYDTMFALRTVREVLEARGFDPTEDVVDILKGEADPENPDRKLYHVETEVRLRACSELMKFVHPTLKAVEMNTTVQLRGPALDERLRQLLARAKAISERDGVDVLAPAEPQAAEPDLDPELPPRPFRAEDML